MKHFLCIILNLLSLICCEIAKNNSPRAGCEQNPSFSGSDIWIDPRLSLWNVQFYPCWYIPIPATIQVLPNSDIDIDTLIFTLLREGAPYWLPWWPGHKFPGTQHRTAWNQEQCRNLRSYCHPQKHLWILSISIFKLQNSTQ